MESREQKLAINHLNGPCMVLAGPGSGKTFVLTNRIKHLIFDEDIEPKNILVITFTRQAANEMKNRFVKLCNENNLILNDEPTFGTFHSIFFEILRNDFGFNNDSLITKTEEKKYIVNILEKKNKIKITDNLADDILKDIKGYKLSKEKGESFSPKVMSVKDFHNIYDEFKQYLFLDKKLDFHDMIELCFTLLKKNKEILDKYQKLYKYILIDEFQDINNEQYDIIKLLSKTKNLFVVGDDDQSIYKFRGSKPSVMNDFLNDYSNAVVINLDKNYRCAKGIVNFSKKIIDNNKQRFKKDLVSNSEKFGNVEIKVFNDSIDENEYILNIIRDKIYKKTNLSDIAILYRTNLLSSSISEALAKENIPFVVKDMKNSPFDHFAIRDILSYMNLAVNNITLEHIINIANKPLRYISRDSIDKLNPSIDKIVNYYDDKEYIKNNVIKLKNDLSKLNKMHPSIAIRYIRQEIGYNNYLKDYASSKSINMNDLVEILDEMEELAVRFRNINEFLTFVREYEEKLIENKTDVSDNKNAIRLMTFHSSKGLEFDTVIIIDANDGIIPHKKSIKSQDIETERRLFYVAMTRAKNNLHIYFTINRNGKNYKPSRFILEGIKEAN